MERKFANFDGLKPVCGRQVVLAFLPLHAPWWHRSSPRRRARSRFPASDQCLRMRSTRAQELLFPSPEPSRASRARGVKPPPLKRRSRAQLSWWWLLLVPAVTVPGALLRGNALRDARSRREHWQDVPPEASPSPPLPPRPPPPHPSPHRVAEPQRSAARTHATTAGTRRSSTGSSTKPQRAARQRQPAPQSDGTLRHPTPEGRLRHVQCTSAAQRAVKQLDRVPLLLSAAQAAKQRVLETETPLPTAGLDLALLPASSRLDANGFGEHKTCAVVGASG